MTTLITGAAGFIGSHLTSRLLAQNKPIRALILPSESTPMDWGNKVEVIRGDIRNRADVEKAVRDTSLIFHLAAVTLDTGPMELHQQVTVEGTRHIMEAAAAHKAKVILTSSITTYGVKIQTHILDEDIEQGAPAGFYSTHKQKQERLARELASKLGVELVVLRPGNVYGPRSIQWVITALAELKRGTPTLIGGGNGDCGFVHVDNLIDAMLLAAENPSASPGSNTLPTSLALAALPNQRSFRSGWGGQLQMSVNRSGTGSGSRVVRRLPTKPITWLHLMRVSQSPARKRNWVTNRESNMKRQCKRSRNH
jgi:nucleoside-diphosphate-sugar epimerase